MDTKALIRQATIQLLSKKRSSELTVSDIVSAANINRSSFYYHFSSIEVLFDSIIQEFVTDVDRIATESICIEGSVSGENKRFFNQSLAVYQYYYEHQLLCHVLLWGDLRDKFEYAFIEMFKQHCQRYRYSTKYETSFFESDVRDYNDSIIAYSQFSYLETWSTRSFQETPLEMAEITRRISNSGDEASIMALSHTGRAIKYKP